MITNFLKVQEFSLCSVIYQHFLFFHICLFTYKQRVNTNERSQVRLKSNKLSGYLWKNYFVLIQASGGTENEQRSADIAVLGEVRPVLRRILNWFFSSRAS